MEAPPGNDEMGIFEVSLVVPELPAARCLHHPAARLLRNQLARGSVPLHGGAHARIEVGRSLCDEAELQRAARREERELAVSRPEHLQVCFVLRRGVGTAAHYDARSALPVQRQPNGHALPGPVCAIAPDGGVEEVLYRNIDSTQDRKSPVDERRVYRELYVPAEELLRAVQRVQEP